MEMWTCFKCGIVTGNGVLIESVKKFFCFGCWGAVNQKIVEEINWHKEVKK